MILHKDCDMKEKYGNYYYYKWNCFMSQNLFLLFQYSSIKIPFLFQPTICLLVNETIITILSFEIYAQIFYHCFYRSTYFCNFIGFKVGVVVYGVNVKFPVMLKKRQIVLLLPSLRPVYYVNFSFVWITMWITSHNAIPRN